MGYWNPKPGNKSLALAKKVYTVTIWPYQTLANSAYPPIVFLHGFLGRGSDWLPIARQLPAYGFMPDLPGHGDNTHLPLSTPLTFDTLADGFMRWLDHLKLKAINLVGYSMGGRLALYTAIKFPARINALVLESANPGLAEPQTRRARAKLDDERAQTLRQAGMSAFVDRWYGMELFSSLKQQPALFEQTTVARKQNDPRWAAKVIAELSPGRQPSLWERLDDLPMPVLLMAGALDTKYIELTKKMGSLIPGATFKIIPHAGHNIHLEQPDVFTAALQSQLFPADSPGC